MLLRRRPALRGQHVRDSQHAVNPVGRGRPVNEVSTVGSNQRTYATNRPQRLYDLPDRRRRWLQSFTGGFAALPPWPVRDGMCRGRGAGLCHRDQGSSIKRPANTSGHVIEELDGLDSVNAAGAIEKAREASRVSSVRDLCVAPETAEGVA
jgi:hypothetical protein